MADARSEYTAAGVDIDAEEAGLNRLTTRLRATWPPVGTFGEVKLPFGQYANVVDFGGVGMAIGTDGVGSKVLVAQWMNRYDTVGIDCVAMNVNDLLCVGATPVSIVDYIAMDAPNTELIDELSKGLLRGAEMSHCSIVGGEIAQMADVIKGDREGFAFDLAATAVGRVDLDKIIVGRSLRPGDVIIGIESSGVHSNGVTLARKVFFKDQHFELDWTVPGSPGSLGEALLRPTHIYVEEIVDLFERGTEIHGLAHITSEGFINLSRLDAPVGYVIDELLPVPPIFQAIQSVGEVPDEDMFFVYNMGVGFCVIAPESSVDEILTVLAAHGRLAQRIGHVVEDPERRVWIRPAGLVGSGKRFVKG